ncbi:MAG: hypothetical protein Q9180_002801 [Flavoplaca navasiana]
MSLPPRDQHYQGPNPAGANNFTGNHMTYGNTLMDSGFPAFPPPSFDQGTQSWSNMPLSSYDFGLPFQSNFANNNGFFQNQQNELPDYDGNDDFYDSDMNNADNASALPDNPKHNSGSMPSQAKVAAATKPQADPSKGPAVDPSHRAAELRARLLASKRPGSATPSAPRSARREVNEVKLNAASSERENKGNGHNGVESQAIVVLGNLSPSQSVDKSSQNPSKVQSLPTHNADIEGLIDEYRATEADKDANLPVVGKNPSGSANGKTNGVANGIPAVGPRAAQNPNTAGSPAATKAASPGSSESGEIHSDQEPVINNGLDRTDVVKANEPRKAAEEKTTTDMSDKRQPPKTPQSRLDDSKQTTVPLKSRQSSLSQNTNQWKSVNTRTEPRNLPLAQRITHDREEEVRSPSLQETRSGNLQGRGITDKVDDPGRQLPAKPASVTAQSRPRMPSRAATASRPDRHQQERKQNEELAALYKRQLAERNTPSPRSKMTSNGDGKSLNDKPANLHKPVANGTPTTDDVAKPVESKVPKTNNQDISPSKQGAHYVTHHQYEQLQNMGIDLSPQGLGDLYEFLEYHRYYVPEYREGFFSRQKRLRALEAEKLALERESLLQFDHFTTMRSQSLAAREQTEPPTPVAVHRMVSNETPAVKPMPPPLTLPKRASNGGIIGDLPDSACSLKSATRTNGNLTPREFTQNSPLNLKRSRPDNDIHVDQSTKVARLETDLRPNGKGQDISPRTTTYDRPAQERRYSLEQRPAGYDFRGRSRSPTDHRRSLSGHRRASDSKYPSRQNSWAYGREKEYPDSREQEYRRPSDDGRRRESAGYVPAIYPEERKPSYSSHNHPSFPNRGSRGGLRGGRAGYQSYKPRGGYSSNTATPAPSGWKNSESVDLKAGDTRYFIIKSWNVENVEAAQRECIWATQPHNLGNLTEAFNTCRNVILVFSVNNSRAFQGYARMLTLPSPSIPAPSWQSALLWPSTDPFRIQWLTVAETRFNRVGHLKNKCNDGQPVLVGRDGQEIEGVVGRKLCEVIDGVAEEVEEGRW